MTLVIRSSLPRDSLVDTIRNEIAAVSDKAAIYDPATMEEHLSEVAAQPRLNSVLLTIYALVAVVVAAIGVYGVMAYSVVQRRHEIGVRLALGAQRHAVFTLIMSEGARVMFSALIIGAVGTVAATSWLRGFVDANAVTNQWSLVAAVALVLGGVAMIACWIPARRAMQVDALTVVRCE
jgi:ABC-type antimicrobial peptide transport system permease subunit